MDNKLNQYDLVIVKYYSDLDNAARFEADFKCLETITTELVGFVIGYDDKSIATEHEQGEHPHAGELDNYHGIKVIPTSYVAGITKLHK
jgi:hypothetical protein